MTLHFLDLVVLVVYAVGMLLMGVWFSRDNTDTETYFLGGRSFSGWGVGLSLVGASISSVTFLAYPRGGAEDAEKTSGIGDPKTVRFPDAF